MARKGSAQASLSYSPERTSLRKRSAARPASPPRGGLSGDDSTAAAPAVTAAPRAGAWNAPQTIGATSAAAAGAGWAAASAGTAGAAAGTSRTTAAAGARRGMAARGRAAGRAPAASELKLMWRTGSRPDLSASAGWTAARAAGGARGARATAADARDCSSMKRVGARRSRDGNGIPTAPTMGCGFRIGQVWDPS